MTPYEFHPEALSEYESAAQYFAERQPGLELRFIASIEATIQRICESPAVGASLTARFGVVWHTSFRMRFFIP